MQPEIRARQRFVARHASYVHPEPELTAGPPGHPSRARGIGKVGKGRETEQLGVRTMGTDSTRAARAGHLPIILNNSPVGRWGSCGGLS